MAFRLWGQSEIPPSPNLSHVHLGGVHGSRKQSHARTGILYRGIENAITLTGLDLGSERAMSDVRTFGGVLRTCWEYSPAVENCRVLRGNSRLSTSNHFGRLETCRITYIIKISRGDGLRLGRLPASIRPLPNIITAFVPKSIRLLF